MIGLSDAVADAILADIFTYVGSPAYLALLTAEPSDDATFTEATYSGYARVALASGDFGAAADRARVATAAHAFAQVTADTADIITHAALIDASTAGIVKWTTVLDSPIELEVGDVPTIDIGALALTFP